MISRMTSVCAIAVCASSLVFADFQYQQTTRITGGSMLSMMKMMGRFSKDVRQGLEPITQTVLLKGNRMAHIGKDRIEIIDLDSETFTNIDHATKQYSVMTFAEMKQAMEAAAKEMEQKMKEQNADADRADVSFNAKVRDGNKTKQYSGLDTRLTILTLEMNAKDKQTGQKGAMAVTADMWMAQDIPGYAEVREFHRKFAEKMGMMMPSGVNPALAQGGMMKGFADLAKEGSKLKGVPVFQVTRMGATAEGQPLPSAAEAPLPPTPEVQMPNVGEAVAEGASRSATNEAASQIARTGSLGRIAAGGIGGLGGFGRKKKQAPPPQEQPKATPAENQAAASVLMEMETESSGFSSTAVSASSFAVPAGYQKVESEMKKKLTK